MGGGTHIKAEALAASDSVPGHLYVTGGWRDVITNTCLLMGPQETCVMREKRLKQRESNVQGCKKEKSISTQITPHSRSHKVSVML